MLFIPYLLMDLTQLDTVSGIFAMVTHFFIKLENNFTLIYFYDTLSFVFFYYRQV
jgi:hypothetical protein